MDATERGRRISEAKSSKEHRQKMSEITKQLWRTEEFRNKHQNRQPWNKLSEEQKIKKICPQCGAEFIVVPAHKNRKCCSKKCANQIRVGKVHINWNPNSKNGTGYSRTLRGKYFTHDRVLLFRSSYELSVIHEYVLNNNDVQTEPFFIWYEHDNKKRRYFPDLLIDNKLLIEIKPEKLLNLPLNVAKQQAAIEYCDIHNYEYLLLTEPNITMLTGEDIKQMTEDKIIELTMSIKPCYQKKKQN